MPVAFKDVTEYGKLVVGDVFLETTLVETIIGLRRTDSGKSLNLRTFAAFSISAEPM